MLTSLVLHVQATGEANLPASLGRAGQLHDGERPKPYTVSNLVLGKRKEGSLHLAAGQTGWLRFTGLTEAVSQQLRTMVVEPPEQVEIDGTWLRVTGATLDAAAHPWAGQISYQDLAAPYLLGGQDKLSPRVRLEFVSPTTFRRSGQYLPLPLPELVFGSLLDRWQAFAPIALPTEMRRFALEAVALSQYHTRTRSMPYKWEKAENGKTGAGLEAAEERLPSETRSNGWKPGGMMFGFTGEVTFRALHRDRYWLNLLHMLAAFAFFSGVGYQTGSGLGQARVIGSRK